MRPSQWVRRRRHQKLGQQTYCDGDAVFRLFIEHLLKIIEINTNNNTATTDLDFGDGLVKIQGKNSGRVGNIDKGRVGLGTARRGSLSPTYPSIGKISLR